jgi:hypothetical protein
VEKHIAQGLLKSTIYIKKMNQEHGQGINQAEYKNKLNSYQEKASVSKLR